MARIVLTTVLIVLLNVLVGCSGADKGRGRLIPTTVKKFGYTGEVKVSQKEEIDTVEQMAVNRRAYSNGLKSLIDYYNKVGNNMKLRWAEKELAALDAMPQYKYIIEAEVAGPDLKATTSIPEADELYDDAVRLEKQGGRLVVIKDNDLLRLALDKYNELIKKHPSSDKIDDAAYRAGKIYEYFKDYSIALIYYRRTYQWNDETSYPARFKEAYILDQQLHRRAEALELYKQAIKAIRKEGEHEEWKLWAEERIEELSESKGGGKLD
jgi:tetratricopeptide (TPR) repeat protein